MNLQELFSNNLKKFRILKNLSQEELGFKVGLHRTYISDIERQKRSISITNIEKISKALEIEAYLLFLKEDYND